MCVLYAGLLIGFSSLAGQDAGAGEITGLHGKEPSFLLREIESSHGQDPAMEEHEFDRLRLVPSEYPTIQDAVDAAEDGDTIFVDMKGWPCRPFTVHGKDLVIRGNASGPRSTITSFNSGERVLPGALVIDSTVVIEHLDFRNLQSVAGGALEVHDSEVHLRNCSFVNNKAKSAPSLHSRGGAVYFDSPGMWNRSTITSCHFESNRSQDDGGAVYVADGWLDVKECTFDQNEAIEGGAVCYAGGQGSLDSCTFTLNYAYKGGGVRMRGATSIQLGSCEFSGNIAHYGAGIDAGDNIRTSSGDRYRIAPPMQSCSLHSCRFYGNEALIGGGGAYLLQGGHYLFKCLFELNKASEGAAVFIEDASVRSRVRMHATKICQNKDGSGRIGHQQLMGEYVDEGLNEISAFCGDTSLAAIDINGDGYVDWDDWSACYNAMITLLHTTGSTACVTSPCVGDVNGDGMVDRLDWTMIARYISSH
ncbi:MAG: hypothetical protein CMJ24_08365 [Phycisphaerae bacterium]|nr:hypothetical protein [Phycisphaerae bacterium]|tara:strand:+ start:1640 stop:3067 length:1428 start_codon:yes stop_codon:yes gene_type:complete